MEPLNDIFTQTPIMYYMSTDVIVICVVIAVTDVTDSLSCYLASIRVVHIQFSFPVCPNYILLLLAVAHVSGQGGLYSSLKRSVGSNIKLSEVLKKWKAADCFRPQT